jgi:hypothetical protein
MDPEAWGQLDVATLQSIIQRINSYNNAGTRDLTLTAPQIGSSLFNSGHGLMPPSDPLGSFSMPGLSLSNPLTLDERLAQGAAGSLLGDQKLKLDLPAPPNLPDPDPYLGQKQITALAQAGDAALNAYGAFTGSGFAPAPISAMASVFSGRAFTNRYSDNANAPQTMGEAVALAEADKKKKAEAEEKKKAEEKAKADEQAMSNAVGRAEDAQKKKQTTEDAPADAPPIANATARAKKSAAPQENTENAAADAQPMAKAAARATNAQEENTASADTPADGQPIAEALERAEKAKEAGKTKDKETAKKDEKPTGVAAIIARKEEDAKKVRAVANVLDVGANVASLVESSSFIPAAPISSLASLASGQGMFNAFTDNKNAPQTMAEAVQEARKKRDSEPKKDPEPTKSEALLAKIAESMEGVASLLGQEDGSSLGAQKTKSVFSAELLRPLAEELGRLVCESAINEYQRRGWY